MLMSQLRLPIKVHVITSHARAKGLFPLQKVKIATLHILNDLPLLAKIALYRIHAKTRIALL